MTIGNRSTNTLNPTQDRLYTGEFFNLDPVFCRGLIYHECSLCRGLRTLTAQQQAGMTLTHSTPKFSADNGVGLSCVLWTPTVEFRRDSSPQISEDKGRT